MGPSGNSDWDWGIGKYINAKPYSPGNDFKSRQYYGKHVVVFKLLGMGRDDGVLQFDSHDDG